MSLSKQDRDEIDNLKDFRERLRQVRRPDDVQYVLYMFDEIAKLANSGVDNSRKI